LLARVALARGRTAEALAHATAVAEAEGASPAAYVLRAEVRARAGDLAGALADAEAAARRAAAFELDGPVTGLEAVRADALARAGRFDEAEAAYRKEIAAFPGNLGAHANLAALLASRGRRGEIQALFEAMAAGNPGPRARAVAAATWAALGDPARAAAWSADARAGETVSRSGSPRRN
jgi:Flp pilus assembly protein TadD